MSRSSTRLALLILAIAIALGLALAAPAASKPSITLSAGSSSCKVGASVKVTAAVSGTDAYEVRIYKKSCSTWSKIVTATRTSKGHYVAYVSPSKKGTMKLKAGYVNSSGSVTAWSNVVSVKVN